uniref:Uncharacterized protein n=1 Tax=Sphaerodactylus townsendi TaxID=933632 RepID=A0ACB8G4W2_9SAUR
MRNGVQIAILSTSVPSAWPRKDRSAWEKQKDWKERLTKMSAKSRIQYKWIQILSIQIGSYSGLFYSGCMWLEYVRIGSQIANPICDFDYGIDHSY